jgi:hypothetical protein
MRTRLKIGILISFFCLEAISNLFAQQFPSSLFYSTDFGSNPAFASMVDVNPDICASYSGL